MSVVDEMLTGSDWSSTATQTARPEQQRGQGRPGLRAGHVSGLILDEPTRGVDFRLKAELGRFLQQEAEKGRTVIVVTHDVEFAAEYAARIVMMSSGRVVSDGEKHEVLGKSVFYSPQLGKMCRGICDGVLTFSEARKRIHFRQRRGRG